MNMTHETHMGKLAMYFSALDYFVNLVEDCRLTVVGKFLKGKPPWMS